MIPWSLVAKGIAVLAVVLLIAGGYHYVAKMQNDLETAKADLATRGAALAVEKATVKQAQDANAALREQIARNQGVLDALQQAYAHNDTVVSTLRDTIAKHNLRELAHEKPALVAGAATRATLERFRMLDAASDIAGRLPPGRKAPADLPPAGPPPVAARPDQTDPNRRPAR